MKKKILSLILAGFMLFALPANAEEKPYGYSEIADINIGITDNAVYGYGYPWINPIFSGNTAVISADGEHYGYIDLTGKWIIPADYTAMSRNFVGDYAMVDKSWSPGNNSGYRTRYGLIDKKGSIILPFEYAWITSYNGSYFNEYGFVIASVYVEYVEKYGAVDKNNNIVIPFEYESIGQFIDGKAQAMKDGKDIILDIYGNEIILESDNGGYKIEVKYIEKIDGFKYGLVDNKGNLVIPYEYDNITYFKDSLFITGKNGENGFNQTGSVIDVATGKILAHSNDRIYPYDEYDEQSDLLILNRGKPYFTGNGMGTKGAKYGAINLTSGEIVIPFEYDFLTGINDGIISAAKDGKVGFIDTKNNIVVPFVHEGDYIYGGYLFKDRAIVCGEKYDIIIDKNNNIIYKTDLYSLFFMIKYIEGEYKIYDYINFYGRGINVIHSRGVMDLNGTIIIPMEYDSIDIIADKYFLCRAYDGKGGFDNTVYDLKGNKITKEEYSDVVYLNQTDSFYVSRSKGQGIIDNKGNYILQPDYNLINTFHYASNGTDRVINDVIIAQDIKSSKYGYINSSGELIVPAVFDYAFSMGDGGYAVVKQGGQWKIIRIKEGIPRLKNGDIIGDVLYSDIVAYIDGNAIPTSVISGKTLVTVEDLANYGFIVIWDNGSRTLRIQRDKNAAIKSLSVTKDTTRKPGTFKCKYVYTDIKTYLSGESVGSYAIDGRTLIDFDLLAKYGKLTWDEKTREIKLIINN